MSTYNQLRGHISSGSPTKGGEIGNGIHVYGERAVEDSERMVARMMGAGGKECQAEYWDFRATRNMDVRRARAFLAEFHFDHMIT